MDERGPTALGQAFYLSPEFADLSVETRDHRLHPVLGGISSTRWSAYERFEQRQSCLVERLTDQPKAASARQLVGRAGNRSPALTPPQRFGIEQVPLKKARLRRPGFLAGHRGRNRLVGSHGNDVLMGCGGRDVLIGGPGDDLLSGGDGADRFRFRQGDRRGQQRHTDTVVDFNPEEGDRLKIGGVQRDVGMGGFTGQPGEVQAMVWMADELPGWEGRLELWMVQGVSLAIDDDGDQRADGWIELPGLGEWRREWILF